MAAAHSKVSDLFFQQKVSILPAPSVFLERKGRKKNQVLSELSYPAREGGGQKPFLSLEETPFLISRWEGETTMGTGQNTESDGGLKTM